jgi:hypothetical protein
VATTSLEHRTIAPRLGHKITGLSQVGWVTSRMHLGGNTKWF